MLWLEVQGTVYLVEWTESQESAVGGASRIDLVKMRAQRRFPRDSAPHHHVGR